jgi:hypothetical protein
MRLNPHQEENEMNMSKVLVAALSLLLFAVGTGAAQGGRRSAEREAEAGGWQVAYGNELTEGEIERGEVQPGVSVFAARGTSEMMRLHDWANMLIQQAANRAAVSSLDQSGQFQVMRFTVRTVRELIRSRRSGAEEMELNSVEIKVGLLEYRDHDRSSWGRDQGRRSDAVFLPYVGMRAKQGRSAWGGGQDYRPEQAPISPPVFQSPQQYDPAPSWRGQNSAEIMKAFSLKNTSRSLGGGRWRWTAYIDGPADLLRRITTVTYYLHPSFNPSTQLGDSTRPGHPLTATGWGVFQLRAEVVLDDGTRRIYEHTLRFR